LPFSNANIFLIIVDPPILTLHQSNSAII